MKQKNKFDCCGSGEIINEFFSFVLISVNVVWAVNKN